MATNPFFVSSYSGSEEQDLLRRLITESIQIQGYDLYYMPKESVNFDYLFGQDQLAKYNKTYQIEAYIKDIDGYQGKGQILSKLGLDVQDDMTIQISIERFDEVVVTAEPTIIRPREGDLVYFGLDKHSIFEITFVENKTPFFQLGSLYVYEINMKRFSYGAQTIETGIEEIDLVNNFGAITTIILGTTTTPNNIFVEGELAYQFNTDNLTYRASGKVVSFSGNTLELQDVFGEFVAGTNIRGETSLANYTFPTMNDTTFDDVSKNKVADNKPIKQEATTIINTEETNPFVDF